MYRKKDRSSFMQYYGGSRIKYDPPSEPDVKDYGWSVIWQPDHITYQVKPKSDHSNRDCFHHSSRFAIKPDSGPLEFDPVVNVYNDFYYHYTWNDDPASQHLPTSSEAALFNARAFDAMFPSLETALNLAVSLSELRDVARITDTFKRGYTLLRRSVKQKQPLPGFNSKDVAGGHLTWSFGISPLISDVKNVYQTLTNFKQRLRDFQSGMGKVHTSHYKEEETINIPREVVSAGGWNDYYATHDKKIQQYATMSYIYTCPDLSALENQIRALLDMLGLRPSIRTLWELIPFSFLVDWIFRVGDWLKNFESPALPIHVEVIDYIITQKVTYTSTFDTVMHSSGKVAPTINPAITWLGTIYNRKRNLPNSGTSFIQTGQFGPNQLALSASLLKKMR